MSQLHLYVGGMACRRCVREVTARLRDVAGVETVAADQLRSLVRLGGSMLVQDVLAAFAGTSYRPRVLGAAALGSTGNSGGTAAGQPAP